MFVSNHVAVSVAQGGVVFSASVSVVVYMLRQTVFEAMSFMSFFTL